MNHQRFFGNITTTSATPKPAKIGPSVAHDLEVALPLPHPSPWIVNHTPTASSSAAKTSPTTLPRITPAPIRVHLSLADSPRPGMRARYVVAPTRRSRQSQRPDRKHQLNRREPVECSADAEANDCWLGMDIPGLRRDAQLVGIMLGSLPRLWDLIPDCRAPRGYGARVARRLGRRADVTLRHPGSPARLPRVSRSWYRSRAGRRSPRPPLRMASPSIAHGQASAGMTVMVLQRRTQAT